MNINNPMIEHATCVKCESFVPSFLIFNYLNGRPAICEECVAIRLGIVGAEWANDVKSYIQVAGE